MLIRRMLSDVLLEAKLQSELDDYGDGRPWLVVFNGEDEVILDRVEAVFYQLITATWQEREALREAGYYLQQPFDQEVATRPVLQFA